MSNVLIIASSPRSNGNSDRLANAFREGAEKVGHIVSTMKICEMRINGCLGCEYCYEHNGECCQNDDMQRIYKKLEDIDIIVFATPIYYQAFPSQLKAFVDRLYVTENRSFNIQGAVLLATYATPGIQMSELTVEYYKALINYHGWDNKGIIVKDGLDEPDDIENDDILEKAFELGKTI